MNYSSHLPDVDTPDQHAQVLGGLAKAGLQFELKAASGYPVYGYYVSVTLSVRTPDTSESGDSRPGTLVQLELGETTLAPPALRGAIVRACSLPRNANVKRHFLPFLEKLDALYAGDRLVQVTDTVIENLPEILTRALRLGTDSPASSSMWNLLCNSHLFDKNVMAREVFKQLRERFAPHNGTTLTVRAFAQALKTALQEAGEAAAELLDEKDAEIGRQGTRQPNAMHATYRKLVILGIKQLSAEDWVGISYHIQVDYPAPTPVPVE